MTTVRRLAPVVLVALLTLLAIALPRAAEARSYDGGETKFFTNVYVGPDEVVNGDVNVFFGDAVVAGTVHGNVNTLFGTCTTLDTAQIDGAEHCIPNDTARAMVPFIVGHELGMGRLADQDRRLMVKLASSAVVVLIFLLFPLRMRVALDRVEKHPALSALVGAIAGIAILPIALALLLSIVGIPLIVLEAAGIFVGVWIGTGAIALLVGRRLCELVMPRTTPSPLFALILGLVVVCSAEIVPIVGWVVTALVWLVGLGAAILSFFGASGLDAAVRRAPIGGPPMSGGWR